MIADMLNEAGTKAAQPKQRHGCFMAYLIFSIVMGAFGILSGIMNTIMVNYMMPRLKEILPPDFEVPTISWALLLFSVLLGILDLVFYVALLKWKRWGFWGLIAASVISLVWNIVNFWDTPFIIIFLIIAFPIAPALLILVVNIGREDKAWPQLE